MVIEYLLERTGEAGSLAHGLRGYSLLWWESMVVKLLQEVRGLEQRALEYDPTATLKAHPLVTHSKMVPQPSKTV